MRRAGAGPLPGPLPLGRGRRRLHRPRPPARAGAPLAGNRSVRRRSSWSPSSTPRRWPGVPPSSWARSGVAVSASSTGCFPAALSARCSMRSGRSAPGCGKTRLRGSVFRSASARTELDSRAGLLEGHRPRLRLQPRRRGGVGRGDPGLDGSERACPRLPAGGVGEPGDDEPAARTPVFGENAIGLDWRLAQPPPALRSSRLPGAGSPTGRSSLGGSLLLMFPGDALLDRGVPSSVHWHHGDPPQPLDEEAAGGEHIGQVLQRLALRRGSASQR